MPFCSIAVVKLFTETLWYSRFDKYLISWLWEIFGNIDKFFEQSFANVSWKQHFMYLKLLRRMKYRNEVFLYVTIWKFLFDWLLIKFVINMWKSIIIRPFYNNFHLANICSTHFVFHTVLINFTGFEILMAALLYLHI